MLRNQSEYVGTWFVTGVKGADGTVATQSRGTAPAASGGPSVTVTAGGSSGSAAVSNAGSAVVQLRAASPFNQVFMSVIDDPLDGFFTLTLPAATTTAAVVVELGGSIPVNTFQTVFSVKTPEGQVGPTASIANTVTQATVTSYQGVWNVGHIPTSGTGTCAVNPSFNTFINDGQTTVGGTGGFNYQAAGTTLPGTMNLSNGTWSFSGPLPGGGCAGDTTATLSASGTCSSFTACSGTGSATHGPSGSNAFFTVIWSR